mmetsp:Transcript_5510/g.11935  ORF Transcript_5510/g.11935 Transcript_5510/m.11935 type:complete len:189 (-) Transcript_5510:488-1054(-)
MSGGGWTALTNPISEASASPFLTSSDLSVQCVSSCSNCGPNVQWGKDTNTGFYMFSGYACGTMRINWGLEWTPTFDISDVAFEATVQGESVADLYLNGNIITRTNEADPYMRCRYWNGKSHTGSPARNGCRVYSHATLTPPVVYTNKFSLGPSSSSNGDLKFKIDGGKACQPDCNHGTGFHVGQIYVR